MKTWRFSIHVLDDVVLQQVQGQGGAGGQHQGGQGGHGGGEHQDHHHGDQQVGQAGEHGGDDGVIAVGGHVDLVGEEPAKAAQEVAAAGHQHGKEGGDDRAGVDGLLALDGVELLDHLGQAPGAQGGEEHHAQQVQGVGAEEGGKDAGVPGTPRGPHLGQPLQGGQKAPLAVEHGGNDGADAEDHDDALDKVVDGGGHIAAGDDIHSGEHRHDDDAHGVVDVKGHAEQAGQAVVQGGGVGDEEDKDNDGGGDLQGLCCQSACRKIPAWWRCPGAGS